MSAIFTPAAVEMPLAIVSRGYWATVFMRVKRDKVTVVCALILLTLLLSAIFAPWIAPKDPIAASMLKRLAAIGTAGHPLGTDELGRDMLSRLIYGGRLSLFIGIAPVINAFLIGTFLGVMAGFLGGKTNTAAGVKIALIAGSSDQTAIAEYPPAR